MNMEPFVKTNHNTHFNVIFYVLFVVFVVTKQ